MEERLCKIVWNDKGWTQPIKRKWDSKKDAKEGWENAYGFIWEDWLFDNTFQFGGYQYAHIEGVAKVSKKIRKIAVVHLFTIHPTTKERLYLGKINNVERLEKGLNDSLISGKIAKLQSYLINKLKAVGADYNKLKTVPFIPSFRFKIEDKELLPIPVRIKDKLFDSQRYGRTQPFIVTKELKKVINGLENNQNLITNVEQLQKNIETIEDYIANGSEEEKKFALELIKRGSCFVTYQMGNQLGFAPSRFLGYVNNNLQHHNEQRKQRNVDGLDTNPVITKLLEQKLVANTVTDKKYRNYCEKLGISPIKTKRKFWKINIEIFNENIEISDGFPEGTIKYVIHSKKERNTKLVAKKKKLAFKKNPLLPCEICKTSFKEKYGDVGEMFIEAHHIFPISELTEETETKLDDLILICSNCHRMIHKKRPWLTKKQLIKLLR